MNINPHRMHMSTQPGIACSSSTRTRLQTLTSSVRRLLPGTVPPATAQTVIELPVTTLIGLDIRGFSDPGRNATDQLSLRRRMYDITLSAFAMGGMRWRDFYHEDRGDGALIIAPSSISGASFLTPFAHHLAALLHRDNTSTSETGRMKLRVAVHRGHTYRDAHGVTGQPLNHLFRLLNAPDFTKAFAATDADLALITSEEFFNATIAGNALINPGAYQPLTITCKETHADTYVWFSSP